MKVSFQISLISDVQKLLGSKPKDAQTGLPILKNPSHMCLEKNVHVSVMCQYFKENGNISETSPTLY